MSNLTIPYHLSDEVHRLVYENGYSVEKAIAKAIAQDMSSRNASKNRSTGSPVDSAIEIEESPTPDDTTLQKRNTGALRIRVNGWTPPPDTGVNAHRHWRRKHPHEKNARLTGIEAAAATGYTAADVPDMPVLVAVIHWEKKSRKKDADNALNCLKHLIDGICKGLRIDDKRFVTSMAFQRIDPKRIGFVDIIIRPATAAERKLTS